MNQVPREIGKSIHLRYHSLKGSLDLEEFPEELCYLYNLQTLDISFCYELMKLPEGLGKLINLRHLIKRDAHLRYMPKGMERLTNPRTLSEFHVSGSHHCSEACALECLKSLKNLRGPLKIKNLGRVPDIDEVIMQISRVTETSFIWA